MINKVCVCVCVRVRVRVCGCHMHCRIYLNIGLRVCVCVCMNVYICHKQDKMKQDGRYVCILRCKQMTFVSQSMKSYKPNKNTTE